MEKISLVDVDSGIGNRLKSILHAELIGIPYVIKWGDQNVVRFDPHWIGHDASLVTRIFGTKAHLINLRHLAQVEYHITDPSIPFSMLDPGVPLQPTVFFDPKKGWRTFGPNGDSIDFLYSAIPRSIRSRLSDISRTFFTNSPLFDILAGASKSLTNSNIVGMHIRTWGAYVIRAELFDLTSICRILRKNDIREVYVVTDSHLAIKQLKQSVPELDVLTTEDVLGSFLFAELTELNVIDLVELFLFSECKRKVGSYLSSFSEVGWLIGGGGDDLIVPLPSSLGCRKFDSPIIGKDFRGISNYD